MFLCGFELKGAHKFNMGLYMPKSYPMNTLSHRRGSLFEKMPFTMLSNATIYFGGVQMLFSLIIIIIIIMSHL